MLARGHALAIFSILAALAVGCGPAVAIPPVHEPLDSDEWRRCAGELSSRESVALIADLTLDAKTMLCQGVLLAAEGRVDEGLDLLIESAVRDKEDHRPHYLAGRILVDAGRYEEALAAFERAARRFSDMEVPTERLGRRVLEKSGAEEARIFLAKSRERGVCNYGCQGLLARLLHETGKEEEAEALYEEMIEDDPEEPAAYVGLAGMRGSAGAHAEEADLLGRATHTPGFADLSDGARADVHYSRAFALYRAGAHEDAREEMERALSLRADRADWHLLAGWIELRLDRPEEALERFDAAIAADSKLGAARAGRGDALVALDRAEEAAAAFELARDRDPTNAVYILKLAHARAIEGQIDKAEALLDQAMRLDREHLPPDLLSKITDLVGEPEEADSTGDE